VSVPVLFFLVLAAILAWWFVANRLTERPWERSLIADGANARGLAAIPPSKVGLGIFLAVVTSFFGLFISAYSMRMMLADWKPLAEPGLLWVNTAVLIASSIAIQWTRAATERGDALRVKLGLLATGGLTFAFLAGQLAAWQQLQASGYPVAGDVALAFFYLLTGLHGLHLLGGLAVWGRTTARTWFGTAKLGEVRLSVALCTVYWHYLLLVWLVLFGLLLTT
jgi:cytochrome c oxidase subunit 3